MLCTSADGIVSWIRGHLLNGRHIDLLSFFAQQIDDSANELRTHAKTRKNGLVFSDDVGADEPGEVTFLDPSSNQLCTGVCDSDIWFETGNASHKHRGVDNSSTRLWLLLLRQPSSPVRIFCADAGSEAIEIKIPVRSLAEEIEERLPLANVYKDLPRGRKRPGWKAEFTDTLREAAVDLGDLSEEDILQAVKGQRQAKRSAPEMTVASEATTTSA